MNSKLLKLGIWGAVPGFRNCLYTFIVVGRASVACMQHACNSIVCT